MTMIGESIAERIAMFWSDYIDIDMPLVVKDEDTFPALQLMSLAYSGKPAIAYFACLSEDPNYKYEHCDGIQSEDPGHVMDSIRMTNPDTIVIHDGHWAHEDEAWNKESLWPDLMWMATMFDKVFAFNMMLKEAAAVETKSMFFLTMSADHNSKTMSEKYNGEMSALLKTVDTLHCSPDDETSVRLSVVDWARLTCPTIGDETKKCPRVHHFKEILPDGQHPSGDSGLWLTRQTLAITMGQISEHSLPEEFGTFESWEEGMENPISKQLLELSPSDGDDALQGLVTSYWVCPYMDYHQLEHDFKKLKRDGFHHYKSYRDSKYAILPTQ
jgi:hypothetical protein